MPPRDSRTVTDVKREVKPAPRPNPILQKAFNFHAPVEEFNKRVETIHRAHEASQGFKPTGALVYDIARSPVKDEQIPVLFQVPKTKKAAKAASYAIPRTGEDVTRSNYTIELDPYAELGLDNEAERFQDMDKREQYQWLIKIHDKPLLERQRLLRLAGRLPQVEGRENIEIQKASIGEPVVYGGAKAAEFFLRASSQFLGALPVGIGAVTIAEGLAAKDSFEQRSLRPLGSAQKNIATEVVKGTLKDAKAIATGDLDYMSANAGYILWDLGGFGNVLGKTGARAAGISKATGLKAKAKVAAYGTPPKSTTITSPAGQITAQVPLSETGPVALAQRGIRKVRENQARKRYAREMSSDSEAIPEAYTVRKKNIVTRALGRWYGWERKHGRELERRMTFDQQIGNLVADEARRLGGYSNNFVEHVDKLPVRVRKGLSRGEQLAMFILRGIDEPGSFARKSEVLEDATKRFIALGLGDEGLHLQRLADIKMARKAMMEPRGRLKAAIEAGDELSRETQRIKQTHGLSDSAADRRIYAVAATLRGELHSREGALKELWVLRKNLDLGVGDKTRIEARIAEIKAALPNVPASAKKIQKQLAAARQKNDSALVAKLESDLAEAQKFIDSQKPQADAVYFPLIPTGKGSPAAKFPMSVLRMSSLGIGRRTEKMYFPEVFDEFTGAVLWRGDWRGDMTKLLAEKQGAAVTRSGILNLYRTLLMEARKSPRNIYDVPILKPTAKHWPEKLKQILNNIEDGGQLTADEMAELTSNELKNMAELLFPGRYQAVKGRWNLPQNFDHNDVLFIDMRYLPTQSYLQPVPNWFKRPFSALNEPFVGARLYGRLAYLTNILGAFTTGFWYQGPLVFKSTHDAVELRFGNPELYQALNTLVGGGRAHSYADRPFVSRVVKKAAGLANALTDQDFRIGAALYYANKHGIDDLGRFVKDAQRGDKAAADVLFDIKRRSNKASGEIDNLTFIEREAFREVAFIYTWRRAMLLWGPRAALERPATTAIAGQVGRDELEQLEDFLSRVPAWYKKAGFLPFDWDDNGNPRVVNPQTFNNFTEIGSWIRGDVGSSRDLGPVAGFVVGGLTGRDEFGNEYPHGEGLKKWGDAALDAFSALPYLSTHIRNSKDPDNPLPPIDTTDRETLLKRMRASLGQTVFTPGWLNGYGATITGALTARTANKNVLVAGWYFKASLEERRQLENELINEGIKLQAQLVGRPFPTEARVALNKKYELDRAWRDYLTDKGTEGSPVERAVFDVQFMHRQGWMTDDEAKTELAETKHLKEESEVGDFRGELHDSYVDPDGAIREWDVSVRRITALSKPAVVNERLRRLTESGVNDAAPKTTLTHKDLVAYGRAADKYAKEVAAREDEIDRLRDDDPEAVPAAQAELVAWKSEQDKPVRVNGRSLPSPARIEWASDWNYEKRKENIAKKVKREWKDLTRFERDLLGKQTDAAVARGWQELAEIQAEYLAKQPPGARKIPENFDIQAARFINRSHDGFYKDFLYAREPLAVRLETMRPVLTSPHAREWQQLLGEVRPAIKALKAGAPVTHLRDSWRDYVKNSGGWPTFSQGFLDDLDLFGIDPAEDLF